jgi:hypothetical protein
VQALVAEDLLEEEVRYDPLAHEPALEVGEHAQNGVDLAGRGELLELLHVERSLVHLGPPCGSRRVPAARRFSLSG